jgi:partner of Y14 and mago protein
MSNTSGIVNGIIPASRRPDGTVRKEIKVRHGYIPPEDVKKYQSKAQLNQSRANGYIAGIGIVAQENVVYETKSQIKNHKRKNKKIEAQSVLKIMHGLLGDMRLEDLQQILESIEDFKPQQLAFNQEKEATESRILNHLSNDLKSIGEGIFAVAKLTELRRLCSSLNLSDAGDRNAVLERIHNCLKSRFKDVYTMDLTRPADDFQSVPSVPLGEPVNPIVAQLVEIDNSRQVYEKKLKALKKKLRQIESIQEKEPSTLLPEQIEKLKSKKSVVEDIEKIQESLSGLSL